MANREFGGKIRSKRSHTLSKPYDRRKSFLNKFTDTVKDILVPSWLSDFLKGKSSAENAQNNLVEENGNEEENEENDNYLTPQDSPAVGDRRPAQPRPLHPEFSGYHQQQSKSISRRPNLPNFGNERLPTSHKVQYPPDPRFSTPTNPSLTNENAEVYSSPLLDKRSYLHLSEADVDQLRNRLHPPNDATASAHLQQQATDDNELDEEEASISAEPEETTDLDRSEAWNSSYLRSKTNSQGPRGKRPSFEPSLFGSPFMKSSLLSDSLHESPFYAGKTRYGGAAANRKLRLKMSNPYSAATPYRKQVNAKPLKSSSSAVTSSTAKRILDTLEMMATPLSDAHRIPIPNNTFTDSVLQFTPSSLKRRNRPTVAGSMFSANSQKVPSRGPPSVMFNSPTIATIAKNRQPLQRSFHPEPKKLPEKTPAVEIPVKPMEIPVEKPVEDPVPKTITPEPVVRDPTPEPPAAREPTPVREPTPETVIPTEPEPVSEPPVAAIPTETIVDSPSTFGSSTGGKMKRDKSYSLRPGAKGHDDEDEEPPVELETNFILPVTEMPKFAFGANLTSAATPPPPQARPPIHASTITSTPATSTAPQTSELFTFSSPIPNKAPAIPIPQSSTASSLDFKFSSPAPVEEPETSAQTFQFSSAASTMPKPKFSSPVSTGVSVAPQLKSGSVLEALSGAKTNDSSSNENNFSSGFLTAKTLKTSGSVMDILGGADKSSTTTASPFSSNSGSVFGGLQPASTLKTGSVMDILGKKTGEDSELTEEKELEAEAGEKEETETEDIEEIEEDDNEENNEDHDDDIEDNNEDDEEEEDDDDDEEEEENENEDDDSVAKTETEESGLKCDKCNLNSCGPDQSLCLVCQTQTETNTDEVAPTDTTAPASQPNEPDPLMAKFAKPTGTWDCDTCMIQNKPEATKCVACETPKPAPAPAPPKVDSALSKPDELLSKFLKPTGAWECDTCLVQNKAETLKCCACETPKPGQAAPISAAAAAVCQKVDPLMAKFLKPTGSWDCSVCMIQNKSSDRACVACQTPNPDAPPAPAPASTDAVGLGVAVAPSSSQSSSSVVSMPLGATRDLDKPLSIWKCDTCLISNPPQFQKCVACDTPRIKPAVMATIAAISSGSADVLPKFGAGVVSSSGFKFGSQSDSSAPAAASTGGFKFGSTTTTSSESTGFKFGAETTSTPASSTETTSNAGFVFGQPAAPAAAADKKESSETGGFKFGSSSATSASPASAAPFSFGSESSTKPNAEEKTAPPKESGFSFSQPSSTGFPFGAAPAKDKTTESSAPLFGSSGGSLSTGSIPFGTTKAPAAAAEPEASKPSTILPAATTLSQGFSFSTVTSTTGSASMFKAPETSGNGSSMSSSMAPATPFAPQPDNSAPQVSKPLFGFGANTDTSKSAEVPVPFAFGASSEPKTTGLSESKPAFGANTLKRDRDEECDGPSDAKRSFGSTAAPAANPAAFGGGFNFAGSTSTFNAAPSGQFGGFGAATNSTSPFGGSSVTTASAAATTTAAPASGFGAPSFNFAPASTGATPATTNTSQPFVFGGTPAPFSGGAPSEGTFGNKGSVFGSTASSSSSLFDKSAASKPFGAPPAAPSPATAASKPFGAPQSTGNTPFVFGSNTSSFNFSAGSPATQGGIYQFSGKPAEPPAAANTNIYQFGQTPSTNNAPLGANPSAPGINFNTTPNFNFSSGTGGEFNFGATSESNLASNPPTGPRRIKRAVRRAKT